MKTLVTILGAVVGGLLVIFGFGILFAFPTKWLINWLFTNNVLVYVFGGPIDVWHAWGLNILCGLTIKSTTVNSK